jgi:SNF family Na+-dependent transporter
VSGWGGGDERPRWRRVRALTLPGSGAGVEWFLLKFEPEALTPGVVMAAVGQVAFSIGVGGTLMVVYGSHLRDDEPLAANAIWTAVGDTGAGFLAGLAVFPDRLFDGAELDRDWTNADRVVVPKETGKRVEPTDE